MWEVAKIEIDFSTEWWLMIKLMANLIENVETKHKTKKKTDVHQVHQL